MEVINIIEIGERLKKIRITNNMSQPEMAKKLNYSSSYYNQIENGKNQSMNSINVIEKISKTLDVDFEWLAYGNKEISIPIYKEPLPSNINIPAILKSIRLERGLTQNEMACILRYSLPYYNTLEKGKAVSLKNERKLREISENIEYYFNIDVTTYDCTNDRFLVYSQGYNDGRKAAYEEMKEILNAKIKEL